MRKVEWSIHTPAVQALLAGVFMHRKGKNTVYFRLTANGGFETLSLVRQLTALGMSGSTAGGLLKTAVASGVIQEREPPEDEEELDYHAQQRLHLLRRFQLVKAVRRNRVFWGVYDCDSHIQELISEDKDEALDHIRRLIDDVVLPPMVYHTKMQWAKAA